MDGTVNTIPELDILDEAPVMLEDLQSAVRQEDAGRITGAASTLKTSSLKVGGEPLAAVCEELDRRGQSESTEDTVALMTKIAERYLALKGALEARLSSRTTATTMSPSESASRRQRRSPRTGIPVCFWPGIAQRDWPGRGSARSGQPSPLGS